MHGLGSRVGEVNRAAAQIARSVAAEHGLLVAGDLGPTGELLAWTIEAGAVSPLPLST